MQEKLDKFIVEEYFKEGKWREGFDICIENPNLHDLYKQNLLICCETLIKEKRFLECLDYLRKALLVFRTPLLYRQIGFCLYGMKNLELALEFFKSYNNFFPNGACLLPIADIYEELEDKLTAIKYYEDSLKFFPKNDKIYGNLGRLYSEVYGFKEKDKQISYTENAYKLNQTDTVNLLNLFLVYNKFDMLSEAEHYFRIIEQQHLDNIPYFEFGQLLIRHKRFKEGYEYCRERFKRDNNIFPKGLKNQWQPYEDITNKVVLVTYEQGYGDTFMFIRFITQIKCKKLKVLVQDDIYSLIKDSYNFEIYKESDLDKIEYDCFIPMMDLMLLLEIKPETIPYKEGYLKVSDNSYPFVNSNDKFKIGISYEGYISAKYCQRDIPLKFLYPIMKLPNVEIYNFQKEDSLNQKAEIPNEYNVIDLGSSFNDWYDTARAIKNMDLMITTDNGILNLAGALGVKTFGLFNWYTEGRWFKLEDNLGWYDIKPFRCNAPDTWEETITQVLKELKDLIGAKILKEK